MNNNKNNLPIQFTELTPDDVTKHHKFYYLLLINDNIPVSEKGKELHEAMQLFYKEFK